MRRLSIHILILLVAGFTSLASAQTSVQQLLQKVEAEPENTDAKNQLADAYVREAEKDFSAGKQKTAFDTYLKAMKVAPNHPKASARYWELKDKTLSDNASTAKRKKSTSQQAKDNRGYRSREHSGPTLQHLKALEARVFEKLEALKKQNEETSDSLRRSLEILKAAGAARSESPLLYVLITVGVMLAAVSLGFIVYLTITRERIPFIRPDEIKPLEPLSADLRREITKANLDIAPQAHGSSVSSVNTELFRALPMPVFEAIGKLIDIKTGRPGHSAATAQVAVKIAARLGMPDHEIELLQAGAFIHDIGMLELEEDFFLKPDIYDDAALDYLRTHPERGYTLMRFKLLPHLIREIITLHHERVDGSGYPKSLKVNEVSKAALIVGCAETYVALTHHRAYRSTLSPEAALYMMSETEASAFPSDILFALRQVCSPSTFGHAA